MSDLAKSAKIALSYKQAGVDIDAGQAVIPSYKTIAERTRRPEMINGVGGFAALCELPAGYHQPVLVTGTDGVGTKLKLAIALDRHESLGQDLVAMSVNDVLMTGATPLLFLDYLAVGQLEPAIAVRIVQGIGSACELAGCALAGGETAEMPGLYQAGDYDLAGFCLGVVEKADIINGQAIQEGDVLIGLPSSGPHANGFSLIRAILEQTATDLATHSELADQLLEPTRIYTHSIQQLMSATQVLGMAHITGGGLVKNLPRMLPADTQLNITIELNSWQRPAIFDWLQKNGGISDQDMLQTFNCGIGIVACIRASEQKTALDALQKVGEHPIIIGQIQNTGQPAGTPHFHGH